MHYGSVKLSTVPLDRNDVSAVLTSLAVTCLYVDSCFGFLNNKRF